MDRRARSAWETSSASGFPTVRRSIFEKWPLACVRTWVTVLVGMSSLMSFHFLPKRSRPSRKSSCSRAVQRSRVRFALGSAEPPPPALRGRFAPRAAPAAERSPTPSAADRRTAVDEACAYLTKIVDEDHGGQIDVEDLARLLELIRQGMAPFLRVPDAETLEAASSWGGVYSRDAADLLRAGAT